MHNVIKFKGLVILGIANSDYLKAGPALADTGPNARPGRGAPLSSDFMTSSCSVNRVTIVVERRYTVQYLYENWARLLTFERKFASSDESVLC